MKKEKLSFYFKVLHPRLKENCDSDGEIDYREIKMKIVNIKIPKSLIPELLKELEQLGLGEAKNRFVFKVK